MRGAAVRPEGLHDVMNEILHGDRSGSIHQDLLRDAGYGDDVVFGVGHPEGVDAAVFAEGTGRLREEVGAAGGEVQGMAEIGDPVGEDGHGAGVVTMGGLGDGGPVAEARADAGDYAGDEEDDDDGLEGVVEGFGFGAGEEVADVVS